MSALEPGWYADPAARPDVLRWWDGSRWTRWLSRDAHAPAPAPALAPAPAPDHHGHARPVTDPAGSSVKASLAAAILIGAVLLALIAVGAIIALSEDRLPTGPAVAPPPVVPPIPKTPVTFDPASRAASVNEFRAVLPASPFVCDPPKEQSGVFFSAVACNAPVHRNFNRTGDDWYAAQVLGVLDPDLTEPGDLAATADKLTDAVISLYYSDHRVTVKKRELKRLGTIAPDGKAVILTMQLHYSVRGLPSSYDKLVIGLFQLADGEYATWLAGKPNDADKRVGKVLDASAASVRALP